MKPTNDVMVNKNKQIAVLTVSYNHEKWIAQCIESVLAQECSMPVVQYIWDDNSPDSTFDIAQQYQQRYPERIVIFKQPANRGAANNYFDCLTTILQNPQNEYIAWLDGDDYWCDTKHLQEKTAYLNQNPDCGIVHSNIYILHTNGKQSVVGKTTENTPSGFIMDKMLMRPLFSALTIVLRASLLADLPIDELRPLPLQTIDHILEVWICSKSKAVFMESATGVWRRHKHTISTSNNLQTALRWIDHECAQHEWIVRHFPNSVLAKVDLKYHRDNMQFNAYFAAGEYKKAKEIISRNSRAGEYAPKYAKIIKKGPIYFYAYRILRYIKNRISIN